MTRLLTKIGLFLLLLGTGLYMALAQEGTGQQEPEDNSAQIKDAFRTTITLSENTILPYEPLVAVVKLRNISGRPQAVRTRWRQWVSVRRGEEGPWVPAVRGGGAQDSPGMLVQTIEPSKGDTFVWEIDLNRQCQHLFAEPGTYWIKAVDAAWESEPVRLEVKPVPTEETPALQAVLKDELFPYFQKGWQALCRMDDDQSTKALPLLQGVANKFPRSRYGQWCRLASLLVQRNIAQTDRKNFTHVQAAHDALSAAAPTLPTPLNAIAWLEAGLTAQTNAGELFGANLPEQGTQQDIAAEADFQKAVDTGAIANMAEQVREVRRRQRPLPQPRDVFDKTCAELEAAGYDIPNFGKNYPAVFRDYIREIMPVESSLTKGEISRAEYYRRQAEILRKYMTERTKPTLKKP